MSLWKIGADDVSQEAQNFKDKLASKDGQIAGQQARLVKQAQELEELKASLNEAIQKLAEESERAMRLQNDLTQSKEDLRNVKDTSRNIEASLQAANTKLKEKDIETRDLETTIDRLSATSNEYNTRSTKLEREKSVLETRIRELESNVRQLQSATVAASRRVPSRTSSAQFNDLRIIGLERDAGELREKLTEKEKELIDLQGKVSHIQNEALRLENESLAKDARIKSEFDGMRSLLQEKNEELDYYRSQEGGGGREEELLQRIEEDEAKISALEAVLAESDDVKGLKEKLRNMERQLKAGVEKMVSLESRNTDLIRERDDALRGLGDMHNQLYALENHIQTKQKDIDSLMEERKRLESAISEPEESLRLPGDVDPVKPADDIDVVQVAKILNAIARIRGERDELRRSLEFLETEHKFTVEALEKRMTEAPPPSPLHNQPKPGSSAAQLASFSANMQLKDGGPQSLPYSAAAYAILLLHSQTELERCDTLLSESIERENCAQDNVEVEIRKRSVLEEEVNRLACQLKESEKKVEDFQSKYEATIRDLEIVASQRDELISQLGSKDADWEDMKIKRKGMQDRLEEVEAHLEEVSRTLEVIESERDSLALQVTNLTDDLEIAQDELTSAESRYSTLQFHQLSSMTSSEATQTLRKQIEELEGRVMRRTEQIGIHQHDIRRLETNLRLQEERLGEMTMELETLATQKEAMLEDCADAREARDEALAQIEALEEDLEILESKFACSERTLNTLICLLIQTMGQNKSWQGRSRTYVTKLEVEVKESQAIRDALEANIVDIQASHTHDSRQAAIVLAMVQLHCNKVVNRARSLVVEKDRLICNLTLANERIEEQEDVDRRLEDECNTLYHGSPPSVAELAARSFEYQVEIDSLKKIVSEAKAENAVSQKMLTHSAAELEECQKEWEKAQSNLIQETEGLRNELSMAAATLEQERTNRAISEKQHTEALLLAQGRVDELGKRAEVLSKDISQVSLSREKLQTEKEKAQQEAESLHAELEVSLTERARMEKDQYDLIMTNERLSEEVLQLRKELEAMVLDAKFHAGQELETQTTDLQSKIDELMCTTEDQAQAVQQLSRELDQERQRLWDGDDKHNAVMMTLTQELETTKTKLSALQQEALRLQSAIERSEELLAKSEGEKDHLHENITGLEAQIQKSLSYTHSLECQIQDGERALEALKTNFSETKVELSRAEVSLSLQSAQFKRELSKLQDQILALEPRRDLEETLANLEERNNEMEELLRAKCVEIEENDDRALEMLKENKKLSSKVEALTRKAHNLQTKLVAAKAATADLKATAEAAPAPVKPSPKPPKVVEPHDLQTQTVRRRSSRQSTGTTTSLPSERTVNVSVSRPSPRATSGPPSSTLRPKTPEQRLALTPVFKHPTPEPSQMRTAEPPASIVGVKRRAPDDFEVCESVPPQGFTADSLPSRENESTTPRARRMFSNLQSGFTPIRNKILSSPKRQSVAVRSTPLIQDVTNSPRNSVPLDSAKQSKRSWLGKIRGTASQGAAKPASRQVFTPMGEA